MDKVISSPKQTLTRYLLVALVLSLGFGQLLRFDLFARPLYLHDLFVLALLLLQFRLPKLPFVLKFFLFGLTLGWLRALTLYPLSSLLLPFLYTVRLLAYLWLFLSLKASPLKIERKYFLLSGLVTLVIGLLQYFLLPDMRVFQYLGWDDHLNRLTLPHFDPTFTGVMLSLSLLTIMSYRSRLSLFYSLLSTLGLLLTYSRSVWLSLLITLALFLKNKYLLLVGITVALSVIISLPKGFGEGTNLLRTFSIESRLEHDTAIAKRLHWNLLTGVGLNTFSLSNLSEKGYPYHALGPNNSYLYLLSTVGLLGLIGWGLFLKDLYLRSHSKPVLVFFLLASLFNNVMFYPFALLWILLLESSTVPNES